MMVQKLPVVQGRKLEDVGHVTPARKNFKYCRKASPKIIVERKSAKCKLKAAGKFV